MSRRIAITLVLFAAAAMGQAPPPTTPGAPPEVDQTLRARVDEFFRYHVQGGVSLRKAMEMVAQDTQDEYFESTKLRVLKYEVTEVGYNDDFTRATVVLEVARNVPIQGELVEMTLPMRTTWKIEGGKWMWYLDQAMLRATPMSDGPRRGPAPETRAGQMAEMTKPEVLAALARDILRRSSSLDKDSIKFRWGQASEEQVVFLNETPGVELEVGGAPEIPGFTIAVDKVTLNAKENGLLRFRYSPPAGFDATKEPPPSPFVVQLRIVPFDQVFRIQVSFTAQ